MVLTLSRTDEYFFKCCGVPVQYVPNPMSFPVKRESARLTAKQSPVILFPARISPEKNPLDAIRIFAEVHKVFPETVMKIAGGEDSLREQAKVTALIQKMKLQDFVLCLGFCDNMQPLYEEADVMLMTSDYEGFPMTLLEAKANALPIVAYDLPYLETMQPQTGVLTIASGNISGAAMQVINLLQDSD